MWRILAIKFIKKRFVIQNRVAYNGARYNQCALTNLFTVTAQL
jgi:hypothetical protein